MDKIQENTAPQRSPEWFAARIGKITGSRIASVLGCSPFTSRAALLKEMVMELHTGMAMNSSYSPAMAWGTNNEEAATLQACFEWGVNFQPGGIFTNEDYPGMAYSPDGYNREEKQLLEVKCPYSLWDVSDPEFKSIFDQPHYMAQIQLGMYVMDLQETVFFQWAPDGFRLEVVKRDPDFIEQSALAISEFFGEMEELLNSEEYISSLFSRDDDAFEMAAQEYKAAQQAEKFAKQKLEAAKADLIALAPMGGFNNTLAVTKVQGSVRVDWKRVADENVLALDELDLSPYEKTTADSFRIKVK